MGQQDLQSGSSEPRTAWFVFAGGGTGGHLFPALAVVERLRACGVPADTSFFCTNRPMDRDILGEAGIDARPLEVRPWSTRPWQWPAFWKHWRASVRACMTAFETRRPAVVMGAGGYASGPPLAAALRMGIPAFLFNPDALPGRANRYFAKRRGLNGIFAQWPVSREHLPPGAPVVVTGCPVRSVFRAAIPSRERALAAWGLDPDRRTVLVTGASQGARTINEAMMRLGGLIASHGWQVLHLSGQADQGRVAAAYAEARTPAQVHAFTDRMAEAMAACDLIVSRAGASTLAEVLAMGKPSVLLPYPFHRDRHQSHNARVLVEGGAAVMIDDRKDASANARELKAVLGSLMADDARRERMSAAARSLDRPGAADDIAGHLCRTAGLSTPMGAAGARSGFTSRRTA